MKLSRVEVKEVKGGITDGTSANRKFEPGQLVVCSKKSFLSCPRCGETIDLGEHKVTIFRPAGKPCTHPGCANHLVYPCEGCRKAWGLKASIEPSIRHESCHLHIYIRDNRITYLSDI
jgi:hypothetical protein